MEKTRAPLSLLSRRTLALALVSVSFALPLAVQAEAAVNRAPSLMVSDEPLPAELERQLYVRSFEPSVIRPEDLSDDNYYVPTDTVVGQKIKLLRAEQFTLQQSIASFSKRLSIVEDKMRDKAIAYNASVATINTRLQVGTTPGNPRLVAYLMDAEDGLENMSEQINQLNDLAVEVSESASLAGFLLKNTRESYHLTGAIEEDHIQLAQLEETLNNTTMVLDRLLNDINDHITRTSSYLKTEHANLRALSIAVRAGGPVGRSLSNLPFSAVGDTATPLTPVALTPQMTAQPAPAAAPRPLVKIRFDQSKVDYEQPVYMAINEALTRYPSARFELVAVHPETGNAAKQAIENTRARRHAEEVLRSLSEMGVPADRIDMSHTGSAEATGSEVHIYIR